MAAAGAVGYQRYSDYAAFHEMMDLIPQMIEADCAVKEQPSVANMSGFLEAQRKVLEASEKTKRVDFSGYLDGKVRRFVGDMEKNGYVYLRNNGCDYTFGRIEDVEMVPNERGDKIKVIKYFPIGVPKTTGMFTDGKIYLNMRLVRGFRSKEKAKKYERSIVQHELFHSQHPELLPGSFENEYGATLYSLITAPSHDYLSDLEDYEIGTNEMFKEIAVKILTAIRQTHPKSSLKSMPLEDVREVARELYKKDF